MFAGLRGLLRRGGTWNPKPPPSTFWRCRAGVKSHGSGWWGARDSREAQARGVPGQAQPRAPSCLLSVPACPAHSMLLGARAWRGLSPTFSAVSAPGAAVPGGGEGSWTGDTLPPHMAHSGPTLSYPVSQVRSGEQDLKGLVQSLRLAPWVDRSISMTPSLRMALSSFRSRRNVVLGHPGGEIGWEQGWAVCCGSAISCPS